MQDPADPRRAVRLGSAGSCIVMDDDYAASTPFDFLPALKDGDSGDSRPPVSLQRETISGVHRGRPRLQTQGWPPARPKTLGICRP